MNPNAPAPAEHSKDDDFLFLKDFFFLCLSKWRWIIASVILYCGAALWYLLSTQPTYERTATILIKEENNSRFSGSNLDALFTESGIRMNESYVYNELSVIQSPSILTEAGKRIGLDVCYETDGSFHRIPLYGEQLPVKVIFHSLTTEDYGQLTLHLNGNSFEMSGFTFNDEEQKTTVKGQYNAIVNTPVGKVSVVPQPCLKAFLAECGKPLYVEHRTDYMMTTIIQSSISAGLVDNKGTLIAISYRDIHPKRAEDIISTVIDVYKESWVNDKNQITRATSNFITDRLGVLERELGDVDADISSYKSANLLPDVTSASNLYMQQSKENSAELLKLHTQHAMASFVRDYLKKESNKNELLPVNTGLENIKIEQQINEYNSTLLQRNNLATNSTESNPLIAQYDSNLAQLRASIQAGIDNLLVSLNTQIRHMEMSENRTISQIASSPNQAKYLQSVGRQQQVKETLYLFLLQKREENELSQAFTAYNTRVIQAPSGSIRPVSPNRRNILLIAFLVGLALPIAIIYFLESLNSKLRGLKDLENIQTPVLGEIPEAKLSRQRPKWMFWKKEPQKKVAWIVKTGNRDVVNEAFRVMRSNLEFTLPEKDKLATVCIFTSFNPNSGKSFLSMNTAASFAIKGKRVLVIDGDLRKGSASAYVGSPALGISHYLNGHETDLSKLIVEAKNYPGLHVLPIGIVPPNPTELLSSPRLQELIDEVRKQYDIIFFDCPPIKVVADTQIIARVAERTILVVRSGLLERAMIPQIDQLYEGDQFPALSVILNGTKIRNQRYGYTYRYGYGYGYGYGYEYGK